jgi:hypothetical protein
VGLLAYCCIVDPERGDRLLPPEFFRTPPEVVDLYDPKLYAPIENPEVVTFSYLQAFW